HSLLLVAIAGQPAAVPYRTTTPDVGAISATAHTPRPGPGRSAARCRAVGGACDTEAQRKLDGGGNHGQAWSQEARAQVHQGEPRQAPQRLTARAPDLRGPSIRTGCGDASAVADDGGAADLDLQPLPQPVRRLLTAALLGDQPLDALLDAVVAKARGAFVEMPFEPVPVLRCAFTVEQHPNL